ncbi:MAG: coproporphyrinogen dehydrogenase HemZ [Negativicutes bacterium]|nr:coproporphyrinogen dehydrogenase HemZ [Negativicutes bacterium]
MAKNGDVCQMKPWGQLNGVRPGKIVHKLWQQGKTDAEILRHLQENDQVSPAKSLLLLRVCQEERLAFTANFPVEKKIGIYLGIPFCPSRCVYCSFASHPIGKVQALVQPFCDQLLREVEATVDAFPEMRQRTDQIYIGGGTPACLSGEQVETLLDCLQRNFPRATEITFEGGRPELMTEALLRRLQGRVSRICINPQSLQTKTLQRIGRFHTAHQVEQALNTARRLGFSWINMDLIAGLPAESRAEFDEGLQQILQWRPENITIHALALKRASRLHQDQAMLRQLDHQVTAGMIDDSQNLLARHGYLAYYLYRQRDILAGAENIGYTLPGFASHYNILMIAERMNIIGFGVGAASKFMLQQAGERKPYRVANPKDVYIYLQRGEENAVKKFAFLEKILRGDQLDD